MNRRGFLRTALLGFAGLTLAAKLRIDPVGPVAPKPDAGRPEWYGEYDRYFQACRDKFLAAIYRRIAETNPYVSLLKP